MPELPEVETLRKGLTYFLVGHRIESVDVRSKRIFQDDPNKVIGTSITGVRRFAKVLAIDLANGNSLVIHIKLTGQLVYRGPRLKKVPPLSVKVLGLGDRHTHVIFKLDDEGFLYYNDVRQFGWIKIIKTDDVVSSGFVGKLGPEPFNGLTHERFASIVAESNQPIKVVLMDQEKIGGIGNIYANDALWLSKIHPKRKAKSLTGAEPQELYNALIHVLTEGLKWGGASELSYVHADGSDGSYQEHFLAYGQEKKPCSRCKTIMDKFMLSGRGTYVCPLCQRE